MTLIMCVNITIRRDCLNYAFPLAIYAESCTYKKVHVEKRTSRHNTICKEHSDNQTSVISRLQKQVMKLLKTLNYEASTTE